MKNSGKILLVEDNEEDAELTIRALRKDKLSEKLDWVKDGEEALNYVFSESVEGGKNIQKPSVILLDLQLPKISGLEVLRKIKENSETKHIPVVILTSSNDEPNIKKGYDLGANSYIVKPVDYESFKKCINEIGFYWIVTNEKIQ